MKQFLLAILLLFSSYAAFGQLNFMSDFSWASQDSEIISTATFALCEGTTTSMTLTTSLPHHRNINLQGNPLSNGHPTTSVLIPYPNLVMPLMVTVTLTFSQPVANLNLLIRDLDDDAPTPGPEETLTNFRINGVQTMPNSVTATSGNYQIFGLVIEPLTANCNGWFNWPINGISSLSFDYDRDIMNYALLLDSVKFQCNESFVSISDPTIPSIEVGPSPAATSLTVRMLHQTVAKNELSFFNAVGQCVKKVQMNGDRMDLDISQLPNGPYFVSFVTEGKSITKKFIVLR